MKKYLKKINCSEQDNEAIFDKTKFMGRYKHYNEFIGPSNFYQILLLQPKNRYVTPMQYILEQFFKNLNAMYKCLFFRHTYQRSAMSIHTHNF